MTTRLSINCAWICLCLANWLSPVRAADLIVLPEQVVVSADYPAQLVVLERLPDGSVIDRSHASDLKVTCDLTSGLRIAPGEQVEVTPAAPAEGMSATLHVSLGSMHRTVPVSVSSAGHQSPIFPREVSAVLGKTGCNLGTCHGNLHGKAGFRLSLRGDDAVLDYTAIVRGQAGRRIDRFAAKDSLLLRKPLGQLAHQGGTRFKVDSREARILEQWIAEGCQWNAATGAAVPSQSTTDRPDETLVSLQVMPERALLAKSCRTQQLLVLGKFADGVVRDVTGFARFEPSVVTGVEISPQGLVTAARPVDMSISVSYLSGRTASRLTFLAHDQYDWQQPAPESRLDELVEQQLRKLQIQPMPLADDYVFIRRAYLAIVGQLPTAEQVKAYAEAAESTEDKQARLVEHLLHQPGYALLWSLRWSDLLRNEQKVMSDKGAALWHAWMTEQIAADRPLGEFVSEMLTTLGSTYDHPAASFHRTHRDPETAAESIGQVFLGVRLQCARCHNHPFDKWRQDDYYGLSAYFTTLERKQLANDPKDKFDKHIISGDEIMSLKADARAEIWHPGRAAKVTPKPLTQASMNREETIKEGSPLEPLARWLTVDNRMFARNMANRIWYHYMGVGIVDPPDDFRDSNPASNPELLEYLTDQLIGSGYSTRHVARLIVTSRAFRRQSASEPNDREPLGGARVFSGYPLRRMPAEVLYDAISDVTEVFSAQDEKGSSTLPVRAVARVSVPTKAGFMTTFGKPGRLLVCECERSSEVSLGQSLVLVNGIETRDKLAKEDNCLSQLSAQDASIEQTLESLYLRTLGRPPRPEEVDRFKDYIASASSRRAALEDVLWALINSKEFPLIR